MKIAKENFSKFVQDEFDNSEVRSAVEYGVKKFIEWLISEKLEMKIYTSKPLHAKVYIARKFATEITENTDSVITGSSNFSEAGLISNLEFNVELKDYADIKFAYDKFEELWRLSEPINAEYIEVIQNGTWLRNNITPYEIYLKTLYEFFYEEINADMESEFEKNLPENFVHLQYQMDAVIQAKKILDSYCGIESQISLFQSKHNSIIAGVRDLENFFGRLDRKGKNSAKGSPEYLNQLSENSKEILESYKDYATSRQNKSSRHESLRNFFPNLKKFRQKIYSTL